MTQSNAFFIGGLDIVRRDPVSKGVSIGAGIANNGTIKMWKVNISSFGLLPNLRTFGIYSHFSEIQKTAFHLTHTAKYVHAQNLK